MTIEEKFFRVCLRYVLFLAENTISYCFIALSYTELVSLSNFPEIVFLADYCQ